MATACSLMIPLMIPSFKSYNLIHVGQKGAHLSFPGMRYSIVQRLPDWAYLPGWSSTADRSTCACHELHPNNVRRKTKATTHAKMSAPAELQLDRQGTGQSWSEQPSTSD